MVDLPFYGTVKICGAGACPYFEFKGPEVILYDDQNNVQIERKGNASVIRIPRAYLEQLIRRLDTDK